MVLYDESQCSPSVMDLSELRFVSMQPHEETRFQSLWDERTILVRLASLEKTHFMRFSGETNGLHCQVSVLVR